MSNEGEDMDHQDPRAELKRLAAISKDFAKSHAKELAEEITEWQDTGLLRDGKLRELARLCSYAGSSELSVAEHIATRACFDALAASVPAQPVAWGALDEQGRIWDASYDKDSSSIYTVPLYAAPVSQEVAPAKYSASVPFANGVPGFDDLVPAAQAVAQPVVPAGALDALARIEQIIDLQREPHWAYRNTVTTNRKRIAELCAEIRASLSAAPTLPQAAAQEVPAAEDPFFHVPSAPAFETGVAKAGIALTTMCGTPAAQEASAELRRALAPNVTPTKP